MTAIAFDITELEASVVGPVFAADHPDAAAEVATHNVAIAHRPTVIVGAACPADVVSAVHWAGEHGLPVAVEGTGHGAFAPAVGAVLITTRRLTGVRIDPVARTARVGAGVRWREVVDGIHNDPTDPAPVWQRGMLLRELTADTVEAVLTAAGPAVQTPLVCVELRQMGGALARPASPPNAVSGREGAWNVMVLGVLAPPIAAIVPAAGQAVLTALAPWGTGTTQLNWLGAAASQDDVRAAYTPETRDRLLAAKRRYGPAGMFRFGHSLA